MWELPDVTIQESPNYSIAYWFHDRERVESAKTDSEKKARALLRRQLEEIGKGAYALHQEKFYYRDMAKLMKADYKRKGNRSWEDVAHKIKPLAVSFEFTRATAHGKDDAPQIVRILAVSCGLRVVNVDAGFHDGFIRKRLGLAWNWPNPGATLGNCSVA